MQPRDETVHHYRTALADGPADVEETEARHPDTGSPDVEPTEPPPADETFAAPADGGWAADEQRAADEAQLAAEPGTAPPPARDGWVTDEQPAADLSMAEPPADDRVTDEPLVDESAAEPVSEDDRVTDVQPAAGASVAEAASGDGWVTDERPAGDVSLAEPASGDEVPAGMAAVGPSGDETALTVVPVAAEGVAAEAVAAQAAGADVVPETQPGGLGAAAPLIGAAESRRFRERWHDVQASFVDDPAVAVTAAADLVEEAMRALTGGLAELRGAADGWSGEEPPTERLRVAVRRYRVVLNRLLDD
jgi:hypothetical protein